MHPPTTQRPKAHERFSRISWLALFLLTATFSLSCRQENQSMQNGNGQDANKAVPSPTRPGGTAEPIVVTGGSLKLELRRAYNPSSGDSVFTCEHCRFSGNIEFKDMQTSTSIPNCSIPSNTESIIRIDAKGNKPDIIIAAAGGNVTVSIDAAEYPAMGGDVWTRFNNNSAHKVGDVFVKARPAATEVKCDGLPAHGKVKVTIPVFKEF